MGQQWEGLVRRFAGRAEEAGVGLGRGGFPDYRVPVQDSRPVGVPAMPTCSRASCDFVNGTPSVAERRGKE